jgi:hypothetical protein
MESVGGTTCTGAGAAIDVEGGRSPNIAKSEPSTAASPSFALRIRQMLEPGAGLWCIGQMAWSPCVHVHSTSASGDAAQNSAGAVIDIAA